MVEYKEKIEFTDQELDHLYTYYQAVFACETCKNISKKILDAINSIEKKKRKIPFEVQDCIECELDECETCPITLMIQHEQGYDIDPENELVLEIP